MSDDSPVLYTKTVYSCVYPETEQLLEELALCEHQDAMLDRECAAWTQKQDAYHISFYRKWLEWVSPAFTLPDEWQDSDLGGWEFYPTAGSSEAIRDSLYEIAMEASHHYSKSIHVFRGEYEGYAALAAPMGLHVIKHDRSNWAENLWDWWATADQTKQHVFYLSHPSSIDGNYWEDFEEFCGVLEHLGIRLRLDLCYVGCVPEDKTQRIAVAHRKVYPCVDKVFLSLSKVFGVYHHRIGGVFSRDPMAGLWGNKWFKNLRSLYFGERLMERYGVFDLPNQYQGLQAELVLGLSTPENPLRSSDVVLLAHGKVIFGYPEFERIPANPRLCLTPMIIRRLTYERLQALSSEALDTESAT
jgi:hypothetical protein